MTRPWKEWTNREIDRLRSIVEGGASHAEAARSLGRTKFTVKHRCFQCGIRANPESLKVRKADAMALRWRQPEYRASMTGPRKAKA